MGRKIAFELNSNEITVEIEDHWTLLHLLREKLGLTGTKEGCGSGECGACTVLVDDMAVNSCIYLAAEADRRQVVTIEGMASPEGKLHPIQESFIEKGGIQCGFCSPGMIMSAQALLDETPHPSDEEIRDAIAGNICRCTGYVQIIDAIRAVGKSGDQEAKVMAWQSEPPSGE